MIKLFRKLVEHCVMMKVDYDVASTNVVHVMFRSLHKCMIKKIDLSEFTDVWGGDHVLENVLEAYLDEFLAEIGKPNLDRTVKIGESGTLKLPTENLKGEPIPLNLIEEIWQENFKKFVEEDRARTIRKEN